MLERDSTRCPNCGAPQRGAVPGSTHACVFCKVSFVVPNPSARDGGPTPFGAGRGASGTSRPTSTASRAIVGVAAVGVLVATVGAVVLFGSSGGSGTAPPLASAPAPGSKPPMPSPEVERPAAVSVAAAPEPTASLLHVTEGTTSIGGRFFLAEVENTGTVPIVRAACIASGFDASGARLVEQPGYAERSRLEPGERAVILVLVSRPPPAATRYEVTLRRPTTDDYTNPDAPLVVLESTEGPSGGRMHQLVGTVRNDGTSPLRFAHVVAVGRDDAGLPVVFASGIPSTTELAPGESSGFQLSVGTFEVRRPARWDVMAFGRP